MKILVITSCTGRKKYKPTNQLQPEDFLSDERLVARSAELKDFEVPAAVMYTGQQHRYLMQGLERIRSIHGDGIVDLHIISAGYGLLGESDIIVPYNVTFTGLRSKEISARSDSLQLHERVETLIENYELVFFLVGEKYARALQLPFTGPGTVTQIFLIGTGSRKLIPDLSNTHLVPAGTSLRDKLRTTNTALKGLVFKRLCDAVCDQGLQVFEEIRQKPQRILDIALANR